MFTSSLGELRAFGVIVGLATSTIYFGSFASLRMPKEAKRRRNKVLGRDKKQVKDGDDDDDDDGEDDNGEEDEEEDEIVDRLTAQDAYWFPILGSIVLFSLYLAFKFLNKDVINRILGGYLALMGVGALAKVLKSILGFGILGEEKRKKLDKWKVSIQRGSEQYGSLAFTSLDLFAIFLGAFLQIVQLYKPFWALSNFIALSFAFGAISLMKLDSFWTGSALLSLLYFYDVWWVFGSKAVFGADVMVSVATSFEAPIKILFPRNFLEPLYLLRGEKFVLLGLGDIVLPGIYVALSLRYDYHRALKKTLPPLPTSGGRTRGEEGWEKPYFWATLVAYVFGLTTTITMMHCFKAAQPALLYLSPACIFAICFTGWRRNEWKSVWEYDDASDDEPSKDKQKEKGEKGEVTGDGAKEIIETLEEKKDK